MKTECILCPTDLSADSDEALRYAIELSRAYNAELILLHCDLIGDGLAKQGAHDKAAQAIKEALRLRSILVAESLIQSALFGSNVDRVLRQSPCPVLVTRPLKPSMSCLRKTEAQVAAVALC